MAQVTHRLVHLPNFYADENSGAWFMAEATSIAILDFLEVPSRFNGTEQYFDPANTNAQNIPASVAYTFDRFPRHRVSGAPEHQYDQSRCSCLGLRSRWIVTQAGGTNPSPRLLSITNSRQSGQSLGTVPTACSHSPFRNANSRQRMSPH